MKNKRKWWLLILAILFFSLLVFSVGYIIYYEVINNEEVIDKNDDDETDVNITTRSLKEDEINLLLEQIKTYNKYLSDSYPIVDIKSFSNRDILDFAYHNLTSTLLSEFMESDLSKIIVKYFGDDSNVIYEDILCPVDNLVLFEYNSAKRNYTFVDQHAHGGSGIYNTNNYYIDGSIVNEENISISVNILYYSYCSDVCGPTMNYYRSAIDAYNGKNSIFTAPNEEYVLTDSDYENIKGELAITTFHFIKDKNNNYGLRKVTVK